MDGVIVDSEPLHLRAFQSVMDELGFGRDHGMHWPDYIGRSDFILWQDFVRRHQPPHSLQSLMEKKRARTIALLLEHQPIFSGLLELIGQLSGHYALAVASGSDRLVIDAVLSLRDLRRHFPVVVSGGEVAQGKPAPDIFLLAAQKLGLAPEQCWVIEDSQPGVAAGRAAGMRVVAVANTLPPEQLQAAHHVIRQYDEVPALLATAR